MKKNKVVKPFHRVMKTLHTNYVMPTKSDKKHMTKYICICVIIRIITFCFFVLGGFLHFFKIVSENIEEIDASEDVVVVSAGIGTLSVLVMFTYLHKDWETFLKDVVDFSTYGKPNKTDEVVRQLDLWGRWFGYYYVTGCLVYGSISCMEAPHCNKINKEHNLHLICDTFVPIWLPFDVPNKFYRYLIFFVQLVLVISSVEPAAMICFLSYESTEMLGLHIKNLKSHFAKIIAEKDIKFRTDGLGYWVRYHNHILKLAGDLRLLVKKSVGHLAVISALVFGCAEAQLIKGVKPLGALIFFVGWLVAVLLLCHAGERIMNLTLSVHDAVRDSNWYKAESDIQKSVVFILLRSQKPMYLDALPFGAMNYSLYIMMLRTSYSYMTLLNQSVQ